MLTVPFKRVLDGVFKLAGVIPADVSDEINLAVIQAIADRYKFAHSYYPFPVLSRLEQRFFRAAWDAGTTYAAGAEIYSADEDAYYSANEAPDTPAAGESPTTNPEKWTELTEFHRYVAYEQTGETAIDAVTGAWDEDPRAMRSALELRWKNSYEGLTFAPDYAGTSVWLEFRPRPAKFAAEIYSATATYAAGDVVYFPEIGDVYECVTATSAAETPLTHSAKWTLQEMPDFLELAVKAGALADYLTGDERPNAAARWDAKFIELLDEQVWQLTKLQGQTGRARYSPR